MSEGLLNMISCFFSDSCGTMLQTSVLIEFGCHVGPCLEPKSMQKEVKKRSWKKIQKTSRKVGDTALGGKTSFSPWCSKSMDVWRRDEREGKPSHTPYRPSGVGGFYTCATYFCCICFLMHFLNQVAAGGHRWPQVAAGGARTKPPLCRTFKLEAERVGGSN